MVRSLVLLSFLLVGCQTPDTMTATIEMKPYTFIADSLPVSILVRNADTLSYSVWYEAIDDDGLSQWIERNQPVEGDLSDLDGLVRVDTYFRTCEPTGHIEWDEEVCNRRWLIGRWEIRVKIWRWVDGVKEEKQIVKGFRVL